MRHDFTGGARMATRVLRFEVEEAGAVVLVEVDDDAAVGPVSRGGVPERARQTFEAAIAQIRPAIEIVTRQEIGRAHV